MCSKGKEQQPAHERHGSLGYPHRQQLPCMCVMKTLSHRGSYEDALKLTINQLELFSGSITSVWIVIGVYWMLTTSEALVLPQINTSSVHFNAMPCVCSMQAMPPGVVLKVLLAKCIGAESQAGAISDDFAIIVTGVRGAIGMACLWTAPPALEFS